MKTRIAPMIVLALGLSAPAFAEAPRVVADIAPVHALVAHVMEGVGTPTLLVGPGESPHSFALRASQAQALEQAALVVWVGHGLTPWLEGPLETLSAGAGTLELLELEGTALLPMRDEVLFEDESAHNHDHDHEHGSAGGMDPHAWLDPRNGALWLGAIADRLAEVDPGNATIYRSNAARGQAALADLERELHATLAPARARSFIVFHDAYHYFEDRFGLTTRGALALSDAQPPSPKRLQELRAALDDVDCIFTEPQFSTGLVDTLLDGTRIGTAQLDPLGAALVPGPQLYPDSLRAMAAEIVGCGSAS